MVLIETDLPGVLDRDASLWIRRGTVLWNISDVAAGEEVGMRGCACVSSIHVAEKFSVTVLDRELVELTASERRETDSNCPEVPLHLLSSQSWKSYGR